jgi:hypothetical protein
LKVRVDGGCWAEAGDHLLAGSGLAMIDTTPVLTFSKI